MDNVEIVLDTFLADCFYCTERYKKYEEKLDEKLKNSVTINECIDELTKLLPDSEKDKIYHLKYAIYNEMDLMHIEEIRDAIHFGFFAGMEIQSAIDSYLD